jgi:hypothetical protein
MSGKEIIDKAIAESGGHMETLASDISYVG